MGIFRDQGGGGTKGEGKELCDLLVVFGNDILIFSDKACEFKDTGNLQLDWSRWFRKAVERSADQVWGAERWIKEHPNRLFATAPAQKPFPLELPQPPTAQFHRIVIAHGVSERCYMETGGSGSLTVDTAVTGIAHLGVAPGATCTFFETRFSLIDMLKRLTDFPAMPERVHD